MEHSKQNADCKSTNDVFNHDSNCVTESVVDEKISFDGLHINDESTHSVSGRTTVEEDVEPPQNQHKISTDSSSNSDQMEEGKARLGEGDQDGIFDRTGAMSPEEFRRAGYRMIDYIIDYQKTLRSRSVMPEVEPGYMRHLIPREAPEDPESFCEILDDVDRVILPGMAHWLSPQFHAYYPSGSCNPALLGDMLSDAFGCVGISWASAPACTELEVHMMDWLGKLLRLPDEFLFESGLGGGGVIQGSACETTFITMLAARSCKVRELLGDTDSKNEKLAAKEYPRLVAFTSDQAHSSAARAGLLSGLRIRSLPSDENCSLRGNTLQNAIDDEIRHGNIPFYFLASLGTTASCAFDSITELGPICKEYGLWMHIDAAYAGASFICSEFRPLLNGVEYAMSFNFNPHKFLLTALDCSALWVRCSKNLTDVFQVHALFLKTAVYNMPNYRHWAIQLSRRFRALKLWFVIRMYGASGLRAHIRRHVALARQFEVLVNNDSRFMVAAPVKLGLVCFRLRKYGNVINDHLLSRINNARCIHMVPAMLHNETYVIRFVICSEHTCPSDVEVAWREIQQHATELLASNEVQSRGRMLWSSVRVASLGLRLFHHWNSV